MKNFMGRNAGSKAGFTLMEIMITLSLATLLYGGFYGVLTAYSRQMKQSTQYFKTHQSARHAQALLARDLNEAVRVENQREGEQTGDELLILALPSIDADGDPLDIQNTFDYVTYRLDAQDSSELVRELEVDANSTRNGGQDSNRVVADGIAALLFSSDGENLSDVADATALSSVRAQITSQQATIDTNQTTQVDNEFVLRNHS